MCVAKLLLLVMPSLAAYADELVRAAHVPSASTVSPSLCCTQAALMHNQALQGHWHCSCCMPCAAQHPGLLILLRLMRLSGLAGHRQRQQ